MRVVLAYAFLLGGSLTALASFGLWPGFWIAVFVGVWAGIWIVFSTFWRWADETRHQLLKRRGYH